jgi:DNA-binding MarR family transcriptional regulator
MAKSKEELKSLIDSLNKQHNDLRISNSFDLLVVFGLMHKYFDAGYRKTKLKRTQVMILSYILANGGTTTPSELRNAVFKSNNAISKSLDGLENLGLIKSSASKADRRLRRATLTEKGLNSLRQILSFRRILFAKATNSLSREEGEQLKSILQKLISDLTELTEKKPKKEKEKFYF